ncbi:MAG: hypothetical protein GY791_06210 [Alphaproteobacteria bacterium]|nr:hypothetical protein [Alphaproteobacteria bacterium]
MPGPRVTKVTTIGIDAPPRVLLSLAARAVKEGRLDEAKGHLLKAAETAGTGTKDARSIAAQLNNLATAFVAARRDNVAVTLLERAVVLDPDYPLASLNLGTIHLNHRNPSPARRAFDRVLSLTPDNPAALAGSLDARLMTADWKDLESDTDRLMALIKRYRSDGRSHNVRPFLALQLDIDNAERRRIAEDWAAPFTVVDVPERREPHHGPLKIGYLSADFRNHPVAHLLAPLFGAHDRAKVEVCGYSFGADDGSAERQRIEGGCDKFVDLNTLDDGNAAAAVAADGIDILIDLVGWTGSVRAGVLAPRPAPVQVAYFGYPGTSGAPWIDYIIADPVVLPKDDYSFFSEQVITLPRTYLVSDPDQAETADPLRRADCGLPEEAIVFACFNHANRLEPAVFALWMEILTAVTGSVLWLHADYEETKDNLRHAAAQKGVDPGRIVFAQRENRPRHLRRQQCADLFLDTLIYNAHATACDSLSSGLPLLTCRGRSFAGRAAASVLTTLGLDDLIAEDHGSYVAQAIALAEDPARLKNVRRRLEEALRSSRFRDIGSFARDLERAYELIWRNHAAGKAPRDFDL